MLQKLVGENANSFLKLCDKNDVSKIRIREQYSYKESKETAEHLNIQSKVFCIYIFSISVSV